MSNDSTRVEQLQALKHPVYSDRKLRLGTFGTNASGGGSMTSVEGVLGADWKDVVTLAKMSDEMQFEAIVPVGRWKGFGGATNFNGSSFESYSFAAGLSSVTSYSGLFSTSHIPTVHPLFAAKQAASIDHISGGRFALNVVTGWAVGEMDMFGVKVLPHDERYEMADEWATIVKRLWTSEEPFSYEGKYFQLNNAEISPLPLQSPHPVLMSAGSSPAGRRFASKHCDVVFINLDANEQTLDGTRAKVAEFKRQAREDFGRELKIWTYAYVVQGDTEADAHAFHDHYVNTKGDWEGAANVVKGLGINSESFDPETLEALKGAFIAGWAGFPIVGTKEQVADTLIELAETGLDGVLLIWPRYIEDMQRFQTETYPLLVQAGVR